MVVGNGQLSQPTAKIWDNCPNPPPNLGTIVQTHRQNLVDMLAVVEDVGVTGGCMLGVMVSVIQLILCHHDVLAKSALNNCLLATSITLIIEMIGI